MLLNSNHIISNSGRSLTYYQVLNKRDIFTYYPVEEPIEDPSKELSKMFFAEPGKKNKYGSKWKSMERPEWGIQKPNKFQVETLSKEPSNAPSQGSKWRLKLGPTWGTKQIFKWCPKQKKTERNQII